MVNGRLKGSRLLALAIYCSLLLICEILSYSTIFFADRAVVNVGVITTIWSIDPMCMALSDYVLFGQKLKYYHIIGVLAIVACSAVISMSDYVFEDSPSTYLQVKKSPTWVAVVFGLVAPIAFTTYQSFVKHATSPRVNFEPT